MLTFTSAPTLMHCPRDWRWITAPLPDHDFWLVLGGKGRLWLNSVEYLLSPGSALWLRPGDQPAAEHDPAHPLFVFFFHFKDPPSPPPRNVRRACGLRRLGLAESWARLAVTQARHRDPLVREQAVHAAQLLLLEWQTEQKSTHTVDADAQTRVEALVEDILREPGRSWQLSTMARRAGISVAHLSRIFHRNQDCPPMEFVIRARMNRARHLLRHTRLSVATIAETLGYPDIFPFSRQFKARTRLSPLQWRQRGGEAEPRRASST